MPTFTCKGTRRYRYYETRRDLVGPGEPSATRFAMRTLDRHIIDEVRKLVSDEHALRRWLGTSDAQTLKAVFARAASAKARLAREESWSDVIRSMIGAIRVRNDHLELTMAPEALGIAGCTDPLLFRLPLPARKPFREAKLRIDGAGGRAAGTSGSLVALLREAHQAQKLALGSPDRSLNVIAGREGRCRKQMAKLLRVSWLSPRVVEAIIDGRLDDRFDRKHLLEMDVPVNWSDQHRLFGLS